MRLWGLVGAVLLAAAATMGAGASGIDISDDELAEALDRGDLSVADFVRLQDVQHAGDDSLARELQSAVMQPIMVDVVELGEPFASNTQTGSAPYHARVRHTYTQRNRHGDSRYSLTAQTVIGRWRTDLEIRREYSGSERFRRRSFEYHTSDHLIRRVVFGNYLAQFGMGSVIGYGGRRLMSHDRLDRESFVFPDYSGFNGVRIDGASGCWSAQVILSHHQDSSHALTVGGAELRTTGRPFTISAALSQVRVRHRAAGRLYDGQRIGGTLDYATGGAGLSFEASNDPAQTNSTVLLLSMERRTDAVTLRGLAWSYGDRYSSLVSGGPGMSLGTRDTIAFVDFDYTSDVRGQAGGLIDLRTIAGQDWTTSIRGEWGRRDRNNAEARLLGGVARTVGQQTELRTELYIRERLHGAVRTVRREYRFTAQHDFGDSRLLVRVIRRNDSESPDCYAFFSRGQFRLPYDRTLEFWLHLSDIRPGQVRLYRTYTYLRLIQTLWSDVAADIKLSHGYIRSAKAPHTLQLQIGVEARL